MRRVEEASHERAATAAGTAMQHNHRAAAGIARLFDIQHMAVADLDPAPVEGFDMRIKAGCADLPCCAIHATSYIRQAKGAKGQQP